MLYKIRIPSTNSVSKKPLNGVNIVVSWDSTISNFAKEVHVAGSPYVPGLFPAHVLTIEQINTIGFAGTKETIKHGGTFGTPVGTGKQVVFTPRVWGRWRFRQGYYLF